MSFSRETREPLLAAAFSEDASAGAERISLISRPGILVPSANAQEAAVVEGLNVYPIGSLAEAVGFLSGQVEMDPESVNLDDVFRENSHMEDDFVDVKGQDYARRTADLQPPVIRRTLRPDVVVKLTSNRFEANMSDLHAKNFGDLRARNSRTEMLEPVYEPTTYLTILATWDQRNLTLWINAENQGSIVMKKEFEFIGPLYLVGIDIEGHLSADSWRWSESGQVGLNFQKSNIWEQKFQSLGARIDVLLKSRGVDKTAAARGRWR